MKQVEKFLVWLENQSYWVNKTVVDEKFPNLEFKKSTGVTLKQNDEGDTLIPRRDLRGLVKR